MKSISAIKLAFTFTIAVAFTGCSNVGSDQPETGLVSGTVTLDGTAVANAQVTFKPESGRPSSGTTDASGNYQLLYNSTTMGAKVGKHTVAISTVAVSEEEQPTELLPMAVADGTTLTAEVSSGSNEIDFALESKNF